MDYLVLAATEPLIRRALFVPGEPRFNVATLESLALGFRFSDVVANVASDYRFRAGDLARLQAGLLIPDVFSTRNRYRFSGTEGLLLMLYRLHFPSRVSDAAFAGGRGLSAAQEGFQVRASPALPPLPPLPPLPRVPRCRMSPAACLTCTHGHGLSYSASGSGANSMRKKPTQEQLGQHAWSAARNYMLVWRQFRTPSASRPRPAPRPAGGGGGQPRPIRPGGTRWPAKKALF